MSRIPFAFVKALTLIALCGCGSETSCPDDAVLEDGSCRPGRVLREGDDHGDTLAAATPVTPGVSFEARLDVDTDVDLFSFSVTADRIYRLDCSGSGGDYTPHFSVALLDASGTALPLVRASARSSSYSSGFLATREAGVYARVKSMKGGSGQATIPLDYGCTLWNMDPDDHAGTAAEATLVIPGATVRGEIELAGDVDVFALDAVEGHSYRLSFTWTQGGCGLTLRGPEGQWLQGAGSSSTRVTLLDLTDAQAGRYTVEASCLASFFDSGYGSYTFAATELEP
ncbi:hypothetical protein [Pyxidicoccus xibeiensis]|uniref:hypothetical protein n=1 Tax=Pyxidicoccus xibeiensis TaxID=2906759 RepID=UPI0020A7140D|nr:hypothetical protein [Pyxidicoccus xibeiensis]MCP3142541.1 hypothetical protein [Pyxidicoccus xibeiensis]